VASLEVAVLDQSRPRRAFRRITGPALEQLIPAAPAAASEPAPESKPDTETKPADPQV
jgi:proteasome alpha subunit